MNKSCSNWQLSRVSHKLIQIISNLIQIKKFSLCWFECTSCFFKSISHCTRAKQIEFEFEMNQILKWVVSLDSGYISNLNREQAEILVCNLQFHTFKFRTSNFRLIFLWKQGKILYKFLLKPANFLLNFQRNQEIVGKLYTWLSKIFAKYF